MPVPFVLPIYRQNHDSSITVYSIHQVSQLEMFLKFSLNKMNSLYLSNTYMKDELTRSTFMYVLVILEHIPFHDVALQ